VSVDSPPVWDERFCESLRELMRWRRDVRHFRPDPIPDETLTALVADASLAPSVGYSQPWRFVSVVDAARRAAVTANFERCNAAALNDYAGERRDDYAALKLAGLHEAPVHLAVFADTATTAGHNLGRKTAPETLLYSVVGAIVTMWLLARARGVGIGWVSILDHEQVSRDLAVPESWILCAYLCVGYPDEEHPVPELARAGWQAPLPESTTLYRR